MNFDCKVNFRTRTNGSGLWNATEKFVSIDRVRLASLNNDGDFGELRAYFDPAEWDTDNDGLIYTDKAWMSSFSSCIATMGFSVHAIADIGYSEAGMQGDNYVSMDVGGAFIRECEALYRFVINQQVVNM
jgi:hypothetical protein